MIGPLPRPRPQPRNPDSSVCDLQLVTRASDFLCSLARAPRPAPSSASMNGLTELLPLALSVTASLHCHHTRTALNRETKGWMSPRPAANSGRDNLGNYLILPFFTGCLAYFLAYQMRPTEKIRQEREASAFNSIRSTSPPPASLPATLHKVLDHRPRKVHKGQSQ